MIVDTSALMAVVIGEPGADRILATLYGEPGFLPCPVSVEFMRVLSRAHRSAMLDGGALLADLTSQALDPLSFSFAHAEAAIEANSRFGIGAAKGGTLNLLDLMVYGCAMVTRQPILCTGRDFAATDAAIHPASRIG